ncbi:adenylate/guanylate cyclase domain-containing protein [Roseibium sp.]|uniref:adenylate/guanylate cyclase domain-containing protein n=1 Tax=Roseibium sp. TaxID=1936156 RepID=UPI003D0CA06A
MASKASSVSDPFPPAENDLTRFGWLAFLGSGASIGACYITTISSVLAAAVGTPALNINPHVQAVFMWSFALLAVFAIARDYRTHHRLHPLIIGALGFLLVIGTTYTYYDVRIEIMGYVVLVIAAFLNQNALMSLLNRKVRSQASELADMNASLERRVERQVSEIDRLARLKRFLAPEIADLITNEDKEALLNSHRGFIACLFCDIRNFTKLSEGIEPEEVMNVLQDYHRRLGQLVSRHGGTIGYRSGDGLMVILNDPLAVEDPVLQAAQLARDMMTAFQEARLEWERLGYEIGFGIGLAAGYATLGLIGDEHRFDYTAIGNVVNLASRLCDRAADGEILVNRRVFADIEGRMETARLGEFTLKGFEKPIEVFTVGNPDETSNVVKASFEAQTGSRT